MGLGSAYEIAAWLAFYVVALTLTELLSHGTGNLHNDTLEAYAWGQELQLGYSKHPPFWAWVTYGWFRIFPTADWAAYLLGSVNAAIGLGCSWLIGRRFVSDERATGAFLCLLVTTSYICFAQRFNANTVLLSLWPATTLAVLRAVERDRLRDGFAAGLLVAFCMLSKYQSAIFLATLLAAVYFLKGSARPYYSRAALICYAAAAIGVVPYLIWLQQNDYLPLRYMRVTTLRGFPTVVRESIVFVLASAGYMAPAMILYQWAGRAQWRRLVRALASGFRDKRLPLAIVTFGAAVLTIAICLIRSGTVKTTYAIPMYFMLPFWLAMAPDLPFSAVALRRLRLVVAGILFACLAAAPLIGLVSFKLSTRLATRPKDEIVDAVTDAWHRHYGKPLRIVAGDEDYAISAPFYSDDHPSYLIGLDQRALDEFHLPMSQGPADFVPRLSPWVTAADIERDGLAIICSDEHWDWSTGCEAQAAKWLGDRGIELKMIAAEKDSLFPGLPYRFKIFFIPPK